MIEGLEKREEVEDDEAFDGRFPRVCSKIPIPLPPTFVVTASSVGEMLKYWFIFFFFFLKRRKKQESLVIFV